MKEIELTEIESTGILKGTKMRMFLLGHGDKLSVEDLMDEGITKDEFHKILDRASQPKEKPKPDSELA